MSVTMRCPECGQMTIEGVTEMTYEIDGMKVAIKDVPAQVCANGHAYVDCYTAENVNRLVNHVVEDVNAYSKRVLKPLSAVREVVIAA